MKLKQFVDAYETLYQADEGESRELVYITLTNLSKLRTIRHILSDTLVMDDDPFISRSEYVTTVRIVDGWIEAIQNALEGSEKS